MKISVIEKSRIEVEQECKAWAREILREYKPDAVVFIANSGFLFGNKMADEMKCPLFYISANRSGNNTKNKVGIIAKYIPQRLVEVMISSPLKYYIHSHKRERNIVLSRELIVAMNAGVKNILLVDDAVDTGWTIRQAVIELGEKYPNVIIKTASYTVSEYSSKVVQIDFYRYWNKIILTATSRKSQEYIDFINDVSKWISNHTT